MNTEVFTTLLRIDAEFPGAVVSGGYLRDNLLGVPFKDIDIVVPARKFYPGEMGFVPASIEDQPYEHSRIEAIWQRGCDSVIEVVDHVSARGQNAYNDIGLCKISWSRKEGMIVDPGFIQDAVNQTLTVYRCGWGEDGIRAHLDRLKPKYPGYMEVWLDGKTDPYFG